jgi:proteic killer suppression protein
VPRFKNIERVARRKLLQLHAATELDSLRINEQWRICFLWRDGAADQVEIVDYH